MAVCAVPRDPGSKVHYRVCLINDIATCLVKRPSKVRSKVFDYLAA